MLTSLAAAPSATFGATPPVCLQNGTTVTCTYLSGDNVFTVPAGVTDVQVVAIGASGGTLVWNRELLGGRPAVVSSDLTVTPGQTLHAVVAGRPSGSRGGFNGGADGAAPGRITVNCGSSAGGGGASDIRFTADPASRVLVAAGGGGAGCEGSTLANGGQSGGDAGTAGVPGVPMGTLAGGGGGQAGCASPGDTTCGNGGAGGFPEDAGADGSLGLGGHGGASGLAPGGGGGGGYYGGGGGGGGASSVIDSDSGSGGGGGGGSSLLPPGSTVAIDTTGVPEVAISYGAPALLTGPHATATPGSVDFGDVVVGQSGPIQEVKLTSTGSGDLAVSSIDVAQPSDGFAVSSDDCGSLVPSQWTCTIDVSFTAMSVGSHSATLSIQDDAADSPQTVTLTANGVGGAGAIASIAPAFLDFGNQAMGVPSTPQAVTVTNVGTDPLAPLADVSAPTEGFAASSDCLILAPGESCTVSVTFTPGALGPASAQLLIFDPMSNSPQVVALTGAGVQPVPAAQLDPTTLGFGSQAVGTASASRTVTLSNVGTGSLAVTAAAISGTNGSDFALTNDLCSTETLAPGSSCTVSVTFLPTARGLRSATVRFTDDAADSPQAVSLSGTGVAPVAQLSTSSIDFGNVEIGTTSARRTVTITNTGDAGQTLVITAATISGADATDFAFASDGCTTTGLLSAGSSCAIELTFTPSAADARSASLSISDNAGDSPQSVSLTGTGVAPMADLAVSISASPNPVKTGAKLTYTITIFNAGPSTAISILINDSLSSQSTFVSATTSQGTCVTPVKGASGVVSCSLGSLASGASQPIQIVVTVIAKRTSITNTVTVSASMYDPNLENNTASITTRVK